MKVNRILAVVVCLALALVMVLPVYAKEGEYTVNSPPVYIDAGEKLDFIAEKQVEYGELIEAGEAIDYDFEVVNELTLRAGCAAEEERQVINQQLERYGVYEFPTEIVSAGGIMPMADGSDVKINNPIVYYYLVSDRWSVTTGGYWLTGNYDNSIILSGQDVGGLDGFGVAFTESANYNSSVVSVSARLETSSGEKVTTSNRSDGNGREGFGFKLQDKYMRVDEAYKYLGYTWYGICYYDSDFASFSTTATSYYIHTYDKAYIDSITFSVDGEKAGLPEKSTGSGTCHRNAYGTVLHCNGAATEKLRSGQIRYQRTPSQGRASSS